MSNRLLGVFVVALCQLSVGVARAEVKEVDVAVGTQKVVKRGTLGSFAAQKVSVAGRGQVNVKDVASIAFADADEFTRQLQAGRKGLQADPVVETDVVETETATVLSRTTRAVVTDPDALRGASTEVAQMRGGKQKAKLNELDAKTRAAFDEFFKRAKGFGKSHPLRVAADQSEQALLDAVVAGKGDMAVTTTIVIPKQGRARDSKGALKPPARSAEGALVLSKETVSAGLAAGAQFGNPVIEHTEGKKSQTAKFLAGFTEGDQWEWSRRWDFATGGYFRVKASAWYDYGLRVPLELKGTVDPTSIRTRDGDVESEYSVKLSVDAIDGSKTFYQDVGLPASQVNEGKELVLKAGFQVTFTLHALGTEINERLPKDDVFDFSQDFRPPFGNCGQDCGFNIWIPADVTHTSVNILGIIKGSVRAGVNVGGNGTAKFDYAALSEGDTLPAWHTGDKKNAVRERRVEFTSASQSQTLLSELPQLPDGVTTKSFGYRVSSPQYDWHLTLTPGVRADVDVHLWPIKESFNIQPLWLDALAIKLGTIELDAHAGSKTSYSFEPGRKSKDVMRAPSTTTGNKVKARPVAP